MREEIPDKLYFKIGEVSKLAEVQPYVLRYWESEFNEIQPKRTNSNQRLYRKVDVETVLQIKTLLHERGFTISGAKKILMCDKPEKFFQKIAVANPNYLETIKTELLAVEALLLQNYPEKE